MKVLFLILITSIYLVASEAFITATDLKDKMSNENVVIIDVTDKNIYDRGHIPHAVLANVSDFRHNVDKYKVMRPPLEIEARIKSLGINNDSDIIIYGHQKLKELLKSSYLATALLSHGAKKVSILDGGFDEWTFEYKELVSKKTPKIKKGNFESTYNPNILVNLDYVKKNLGKVAVIESRPTKYFYGKASSKGVRRLGHIPHAMTSFWGDKFNSDKTVLDNDELYNIFIKGHKLDTHKALIIYCTGGLEASMNWYIAYQVMGFKKAKLYDASMREWGNRDDTPLEY